MVALTLRFSTPLLLGVVLLGSSCSATPTHATFVSIDDGEGAVQWVESYRRDRDALRSFYNMQASPQQLERLERFDAEWLVKLEAIDFESLGVSGRIDHHLLRTEIEYAQKQREITRSQLAEAEPLLTFTGAIFDLEAGRWSLTPVDPEQAAQTLTEIAEAASNIKERVELAAEEVLESEGDDEARADDEDDSIAISAVQAQRISRHVSNARRLLNTWYSHYAEYDPSFAWWNEGPYEEAGKQLDELSSHLRKEIANQKGKDDDPLVGDPIGREALLIDLAHEWLSYTPEELIAIGEQEFAWCQARMLEASEELGHGDDWQAALEAVKQRHVPPGEQDELVVSQAKEAIEFLKAKDLVTIPPLCEETWRVQMISKQGQRTLPFAAYNSQKMMVAYPTSDMDLESKRMSLRGNNIHFTRAVTPHELIPGHHLQGFMAQRHETHRSLFRTPFLVEGWALYWEMLEWDEGWAKSPEDRVGMLFWRKHRAARIIVSLKFHLGEMSPDEMIDFLVDEVGHERDNATSEVRRYINGSYSPLYQCGYMIGGLQLRALSREVVGSGQMTVKQFNDAVLMHNAIPIEMIRAALLGIELAPDARTSWKPELQS